MLIWSWSGSGTVPTTPRRDHKTPASVPASPAARGEGLELDVVERGIGTSSATNDVVNLTM